MKLEGQDGEAFLGWYEECMRPEMCGREVQGCWREGGNRLVAGEEVGPREVFLLLRVRGAWTGVNADGRFPPGKKGWWWRREKKSHVHPALTVNHSLLSLCFFKWAARPSCLERQQPETLRKLQSESPLLLTRLSARHLVFWLSCIRKRLLLFILQKMNYIWNRSHFRSRGRNALSLLDRNSLLLSWFTGVLTAGFHVSQMIISCMGIWHALHHCFLLD